MMYTKTPTLTTTEYSTSILVSLENSDGNQHHSMIGGDGCHDAEEDQDDDNDGFLDSKTPAFEVRHIPSWRGYGWL